MEFMWQTVSKSNLNLGITAEPVTGRVYVAHCPRSILNLDKKAEPVTVEVYVAYRLQK